MYELFLYSVVVNSNDVHLKPIYIIILYKHKHPSLKKLLVFLIDSWYNLIITEYDVSSIKK